MIWFEIKKIFSKSVNKAALLIMAAILIAVCLLTFNSVYCTSEDGSHLSGIAAARKLREMKAPWSGDLTENVFAKAIQKNIVIRNSREAMSDDITEQNQAYAKKQEFYDIWEFLNDVFSPYRDYQSFIADSLTPEDAAQVYEKRISNFKEFLNFDEEHFSENEKDFLTGQYESLETPFYYEPMEGWAALFPKVSTFILLLALVIGFFVSGIFSDEFQLKADSIFFSARLGRNRAIFSKIIAGFLVTTVLYAVFVLFYTVIVLALLGAGGAGCPIQFEFSRCIYNVTNLQAYLLILAGGYIGTLFAMTVTMIVSAKTHSTVLAASVPFLILCTFPFLSRIIPLPGFCSLLPDRLMDVYNALRDFTLYEAGGKVLEVLMILFPLYLLACVVLQPLLYAVYKRTEVK